MRLGFAVRDFGPTQLAYTLIRRTNEYMNRGQDSIIGFYENLKPSCIPIDFTLMHIFEMYAYSGIVIATDLNTASRLLKCFSPCRKIFYVWDLEWLRIPPHQRQFRSLYNIYSNPQLELLCRSAEHATIIETCWDRRPAVIEDFNYEQFFTYLRR